MSGSLSGHTSSDVIHERLYIECKYRQHLALWGWWLDAVTHAEVEGKEPVLVVKEADRRGELAIVRLEFLKELLDGGKEAGRGL